MAQQAAAAAGSDRVTPTLEDIIKPAYERILKEAARKNTTLKENTTSALKALPRKVLEKDGTLAVQSYLLLGPLLLACKSGQAKLIVATLDTLQKLIGFGYLQGNIKAVSVGIESDIPDSSVIDTVVQTVCKCEDTEDKNYVADDSVQLQVIKTLQDAVTSKGCQVHETSLLNAVRTCYHIYLYSRNPVHRTTAKAALRQMMQTVFQHMEVAEVSFRKDVTNVLKGATADEEKNKRHTQQVKEGKEVSTGSEVVDEEAALPPVKAEGASDQSEASVPSKKESAGEDHDEEKGTQQAEDELAKAENENDVAEEPVAEEEHAPNEQEGELHEGADSDEGEDKDPEDSSPRGDKEGFDESKNTKEKEEEEEEEEEAIIVEDEEAGPAAEEKGVAVAEESASDDHDSVGANALEKDAGAPLDDQSKVEADERKGADGEADDKASLPEGRSLSKSLDDNEETASNATIEEPASSPEQEEARAEGEEASAVGEEGLKPVEREISFAPFQSIRHKDAYLLFRALCKLSMKNQNLVDGSGSDRHTPDPVALRSKVLSLDLVLGILNVCGPGFVASKDFVYAIRSYLVPSLIKNCVSNNTSVVGLSLRIFTILQAKFPNQLKAEIELVICNILLPVLESSNTPHDHRVMVLEVVFEMCKNVEVLVSVFLNYDCEWDSKNLFAEIVQALAKLASDPSTVASATENNQKSMIHMMGLKSLVGIMKSLAEFTHGEDQLPGIVQPTTPGSDAPHTDHKGGHEADELVHAEDTASTGFAKSVADEASSHAGTSTTTSIRRLKVDSFQQKQKYLRDVEKATSKFNIKPKRGIAYLVEQGYIDHTPEDVGLALLQFKDSFSKTQIGDFLGEDKEFNVATLHAYVEEFNFADMLIDDALRLFLGGFRLPGEAQKIDRMMEKFSARYVENNPNTFPSADTAFVLSFSIMMLQTDLHNPNIAPEKKMKREGFIVNNRGIAGGRDLDPSFLSGIYDRVKTNPFTLKEDEGARAELESKQAISGGLFTNAKEANSKRKRAAFSKERQEMVETATALLSSKSKNPQPSSRFLRGSKTHQTDNVEMVKTAEATTMHVNFEEQEHQANESIGGDQYIFDSNDHVSPMFAVVWAPFCAVFSVNVQNSSEFAIVDTALIGMKAALRVACRFSLEDERRTLFDALIKFTLLNQSSTEMKPKNVDCVTALVEVAQLEGDYLGSSWEDVLLCFSQLARLQLILNGGESSYGSNSSPNANAPGTGSMSSSRKNMLLAASRKRSSQGAQGSSGLVNTPDLFSYFQTPPSVSEIARAVDEENAQHVFKVIDMIQLDRIFLDSTHLSGVAIVDMVQALCKVSGYELENEQGNQQNNLGHSSIEVKPRIFSLQKVVEVADSNMDSRPRYVWGQIWAVLSNHFAVVGCHRDTKVSMYVVDSLRQLSVKFLQKDELSGFNFQLQFLEPFEDIMVHSKDSDLKDLVLRCMENVVLSRSEHLRSGWRIILNVISVGGQDDTESVSSFAFTLLERVVRDHLSALDEYFEELISCLLSFAANPANSLPVTTKAIGLLETTFHNVLQPSEGKVGHFAIDTKEHREVCVQLWTLIKAMCELMGDSRPQVRATARDTLFDRLESAVLSFAPQLWVLVINRALLVHLNSVILEAPCASTHTHKRLEDARKTEAVCVAEVLHLESEEDFLLGTAATPSSLQVLLAPAGVKAKVSSLSAILARSTTLFCALLEFGSTLSAEDAEAVKTWRTEREKVALSTILQPYLHLLEAFILSDSDVISSAGLTALESFLTIAAPAMESQGWHLVSKTLVSILDESTPTFLTSAATREWMGIVSVSSLKQGGLTEASSKQTPEVEDASSTGTDVTEWNTWKPTPGDPLPFRTTTAFTLCSVQLHLLKLVGDIVPLGLTRLGTKDVLTLLDAISSSVRFARSFNDDLALREQLQKRGFMQASSTPKSSSGKPSTPKAPSLLRQETLGLSKFLTLLFKLDGDSQRDLIHLDETTLTHVRSLLETDLHRLFMHYLFQDRMVSAEREQKSLQSSKEESDAEVDIRFFTPVVLQSLKEVIAWDIKTIQKNLAWLYPLLTALLDCGNREVHTSLRKIFDQKISQLLGLDIKAE